MVPPAASEAAGAGVDSEKVDSQEAPLVASEAASVGTDSEKVPLVASGGSSAGPDSEKVLLTEPPAASEPQEGQDGGAAQPDVTPGLLEKMRPSWPVSRGLLGQHGSGQGLCTWPSITL